MFTIQLKFKLRNKSCNINQTFEEDRNNYNLADLYECVMMFTILPKLKLRDTALYDILNLYSGYKNIDESLVRY